ncbi:trace amine-associated receptor 5-like [Oculina patagonica]
METWFWILSWSLSILTMTGNGFVIFIVCRKRQLRTKTNAFVVSLALADFCVGMSVVLSLFFCERSGCDSQVVLYNLITFIWELFSYASALNLCSLVLDRYMAVVKPLKYLTFMKRRRVIQMVSFSWATSITFTVFVKSLEYSSEKFPIINIVNWFYVVFELFLCFIVTSCFASMLIIVCNHDRSARTLAKQLRFNHHVLLKTQEKSAVKMMAVVVCLFLVCYGIFLRCSFVYIFSDHKSCNDLQYKLPIQVLNSACNPLAYAVFKRDIKKEFKRLIYHKKCK